jgi:hypothetical protein
MSCLHWSTITFRVLVVRQLKEQILGIHLRILFQCQTFLCLRASLFLQVHWVLQSCNKPKVDRNALHLRHFSLSKPKRSRKLRFLNSIVVSNAYSPFWHMTTYIYIFHP